MSKYYVFCQVHGRLEPNYNSANQASQARKQHIKTVSDPHGHVRVIEEYTEEKYGQTITALRQYRTKPS